MNKQIRTGLMLAGMQLGLAVIAVAGKKLGYFDSDMAVRISMTGIGLMLLFSANFASKAVARSARVIANQRFLGWSMMLGALVWTASWMFAPMNVANLVAMAAVALGTGVPIAYCLLSRPKTPA